MTGTHHQTTPINRQKTLFAVLGAVGLIIACTAVIVGVAETRPGSAGNVQSLAGQSTLSAAATPSRGAVTAAPSDLASPATMPPSPGNPLTGPLTYIVKPGDNLAAIAAWFNLHGYGQLYNENKAVIGDNPGLIHPGQIITVSSQGMTVG